MSFSTSRLTLHRSYRPLTLRLGRIALALLMMVLCSWCRAQSVTPLHNFAGSDGSNPVGALVEAVDGSFYGTTYVGGDNNTGTIYNISADGSTIMTLYSFSALDGSSDNPDGAGPYSGLVQDSSGALYGTTLYGGTNGLGTVFKFDPNAGFSVLRTFDFNNGYYAYGPLLLGSDGFLYGTTALGSALDSGVIYKIKTDGTSFKPIHVFRPLGSSGVHSNVDGAAPYSGLIFGPGGNLYGGTTAGGVSGAGTLFSLATDGTNFTVLHRFDAVSNMPPHTNTEGYGVYANLLWASDGNIYGAAVYGGADFGGTLYRLNTATDGSFQLLQTFTGPNGAQPFTALVEGTDSLLYGGTLNGGKSGMGTLFTLDPSSLAFTSLYTFKPHPDGTNYDGYEPDTLLLGSDGLFYGTCYFGGEFGDGNVFSFDPLAPRILRIDHPSAPAGSPSKNIIVFGTGFTAGAFVQFNGVALSSIPISSTEIRAVIPASDLTTAGTAQITVNQGGHISNPLTYTIE